ncbi:hypothetical protein [Prosthecomicrobium hirschii]|uniref:hypothetical protein n=1 Tax=Prosthecodimorpha hirschii TaxID=665126 RepID=UPI00221F5EB7|nr:hypothetical protein [Prosthecomicrobium hirschii]MCW1841326.1 hypothetical protein [Prosthecomicrobium hirschii]
MQKREAKAIDGWVLREAVAIEAHLPGFLFWLIQASTLQRQAAFLLLSEGRSHQQDQGHPHLAALDNLRQRRVRDVLRTAFRSLPIGLLGTLARLSDDPLPRHYYRRLFATLAKGDTRARALLQIPGQLDFGEIRAVHELDEAALHPAVIQEIKTGRSVGTINLVIKWARTISSTATDERLRESVVILRGDARTLVRRWSAAMDRLPYVHPIAADDPDFRPLSSGAEMIDVARQFRNCLRAQIPLAAVGQAAFAIARFGQPMVFQLRPMTAGWVLVGAWCQNNENPHSSLKAGLRRKLRERGIHTYASVVENDERILGLVDIWLDQTEGDATDESNADIELELDQMIVEFQALMATAA